MKRLPLFSLIILLTVGIFSCNAQNHNLSSDDFEKAIKTVSPDQILDVRTPGEYFSGHIANAMLADWNDPKEFDRRISYINKNQPLYVYCQAGGRSAAAAAKLRKLGYQKVFELKGGINGWLASGKPLEGDSEAKQMGIDELNAKISSTGIVLVDFGADWCPPCKRMEPVLKNLLADKSLSFSLVKVDGGRDQDILQKYQVTELPVFIVFKDGKQVWRKEGVATEEEMKGYLK